MGNSKISEFSKSFFLFRSGSRVAYLKVLSSEASFCRASDGAIDKPRGIKYGPTIAKLDFLVSGMLRPSEPVPHEACGPMSLWTLHRTMRPGAHWARGVSGPIGIVGFNHADLCPFY